MGVDAKLYLNSVWGLGEIKTVLEKHFEFENITIRSNHDFAPGYFNMTFNTPKNQIMFHVHLNSETPLGSATQISLNNESIKILTKIAEIFGGFLIPKDYEDKGEMFYGQLWREDGLQYFLIDSVLNNEHDNTVSGLNNSIKRWEKEVGQNTHKSM